MLYIRRILRLILCILPLALLTTPALAATALSQNPPLTSPALLEPIRATPYATWQLYQPTSSEIVGLDMTTDADFAYRRFFPVVAVRGDQTALILLQRTDDAWRIFGINTTALTRPGLTLTQFSIDSNGAQEQALGTGMPISFIFTDGSLDYQLGMTATDLYTTRFEFITFISAHAAPRSAERLFADHVMLRFNSGFIFSYNYLFPTMNLEYSIGNITGESDYDNFATFDLSRVPFSIHDAMIPCTLSPNPGVDNGKILLRQFCAWDAPALCEIPASATILRETNLFNLDNQDWTLVAYGDYVGYIPTVHIVR